MQHMGILLHISTMLKLSPRCYNSIISLRDCPGFKVISMIQNVEGETM